MEKFNLNNNINSNEKKEVNTTPSRLISYGENTTNMLCKNLEVDGAQELLKFKSEHPNDKFIFTASHTNNLDVPVLLKTFGKDFNLQIAGNEQFFTKAKFLVQNIGIKIIFGDHFTTLGQKETKGKEHGILRPENFIELDKKMEQGRTPWISAHSFSVEGKMRKVDNGALIEAYRQNAWIIPSALEIKGTYNTMQGFKDLTNNLKNESSAKYHVGTPYKPDPLPDGLSIQIINSVISKRQKGEQVTDKEFSDFKIVNHFMQEQSEKLGKIISEMLPEDQKGFYSK